MIARRRVGGDRNHRAHGALLIETGYKEHLCLHLREAIMAERGGSWLWKMAEHQTFFSALGDKTAISGIYV